MIRILSLLVLSLASLMAKAAPRHGPAELWLRSPGMEQKAYRISEATVALDAAFRLGRPVLIYLHGRAAGSKHEPQKSLCNDCKSIGYVPDLVQSHQVTVVMFHWKGAEGTGIFPGLLSFPDAAPRAAVDDFHQVLLAAQRAKRRYPQSLNLVTHSMGSIVIEEWAQKYGRLGDLPVFDNLVLSAPASDAKGHDEWLSKLRIARQLFVLSNRYDPTLWWATFLDRAKKLGRRVHRLHQLSARTNYVIVDAAKLGHGYFAPSKRAKSPAVDAIFRELYQGKLPRFAPPTWATKTKSGAVIHTLR